jgi:hypothetical protein
VKTKLAICDWKKKSDASMRETLEPDSKITVARDAQPWKHALGIFSTDEGV